MAPQPASLASHSSAKKLNTDVFISRAYELYGDRFDYTNTVYKNMREKVSVRCVEHDEAFSQLPQAHLRGTIGCGSCNKQKPITVDEFVKRSVTHHGEGSFDYTRVAAIKGVHNLVTIRCVKHDETFEQPAWSHMRGFNNCVKCKSKG